jgi:DNA-directed RNA polymerase sigma subunit (sigma70/sigma32)
MAAVRKKAKNSDDAGLFEEGLSESDFDNHSGRSKGNYSSEDEVIGEFHLDDPDEIDEDEEIEDDPDTPEIGVTLTRRRKVNPLVFLDESGADVMKPRQIDAEEGVYDPENWVGEHPAEIAARMQKLVKSDKSPGGSDEAILKDLRKLVFNVPQMPQKEVFRLFTNLDARLYPTVYTILQVSDYFLERLYQVVVKVVAGNTYGKNIYEKSDIKEPESEAKSTYKKHELDFLVNSHKFIELFARSSAQDACPNFELVKSSVEDCKFIRGVYEEILDKFVEETKHYDRITWLIMKAKKEKNFEELNRLTPLLTHIESKLRLKRPCYGIVKLAREVQTEFREVRSKIISPYLRLVYSAARRTAKNAHQLLDNFQNGGLGLIRAISCYSTRRQASFASVAKCWIKQMMLLSIKEDANFVKLPVSTWQAYTQLEKARARLNNEDDLEKVAKAANMPAKKARSVYHTVKIAQVYSLNRPYDTDEKLTLEDMMTNENKLGFYDTDAEDTLRDYCKRAKLSIRELKVLALKHGMVDLLLDIDSGVTKEAAAEEAMIQNLAGLGYNYRPDKKSVTL